MKRLRKSKKSVDSAEKTEELLYFKDAAESLGEAQSLTDPAHSLVEPLPTELDEDRIDEAIATQVDTDDEAVASKSKGVLSDNASFSASERLISGSVWGLVSVVFSQVVFLIRSVVLARLLSQDAFGLFGMSVTVHGAIDALTNFGLNKILITKKFDNDEELYSQLNTIWTVDIIRRAIITVVIISFSYPIASFYNDPRLTPILVITCVSLTSDGFGNIGMSLLSRQVKWKQVTIYNMISVTVVTSLTILVALWRQDAYALAWGQLTASIVTTAISYFYHPYRPKFQIDRNAFKKSSKTGGWFLVLAITVYITKTVDNVFVGKVLGSAALGVYVIAYSISSIPQNIISKIISGVMLPVVAALNRNEDARLAPAISRVMSISTSLLSLLMLPMALLAPELIGVFYGPKWQEAVEPLRILLLPGFCRGLLQNISPIMIGMDRADLEARSKIAEVLLFLPALWFLVPRYGIAGAAWASAAAYLLAVIYRYYNAASLLPGGFKNLPSQMISNAIAAAIGAGSGFLVLWPLSNAAPLVRLVVGSGVIWSVTATLLLTLRPELRDEFKRLQIKSRISQMLNQT